MAQLVILVISAIVVIQLAIALVKIDVMHNVEIHAWDAQDVLVVVKDVMVKVVALLKDAPVNVKIVVMTNALEDAVSLVQMVVAILAQEDAEKAVEVHVKQLVM